MKVYLDHSATTPLLPGVSRVMMEKATEYWANASSPHQFGQHTRSAIEGVREQIAGELNCKPSELIFTSGGTESNNLALMGITSALRHRGNHIITSATEHDSVLMPLKQLQKNGFMVSRINPDVHGSLDLSTIKETITPETIMVSMMDTNNETGIRNPVHEIATLCEEYGIIFHTDAVQSFGKYSLDMKQLKVHALSVSGHKVFGPKGTGLLYIRERTPLNSTILGGGQESNRRAGTENVPGILGFGAAVQSFGNLIKQLEMVKMLQYDFEQHLKKEFPFAKIIGENVERSPYITNIAFPGIDSVSLLMNLDMAGIAVSSGSACSSGSVEPSHVLKAMNLPAEVINSAIRFSFSHRTKKEELEYVLLTLKRILERMQGGHLNA